MYGIAGFVDFNKDIKDYRNIFSDMLSSLSNGNNNPNNINIFKNACLIKGTEEPFNLDKEKKYAAFRKDDSTSTIVFDGLLYNTDEIYIQLLTKGHYFENNSDVEIVYHSYLEWGEDCVEKFEGCFSFAIWDNRLGKLFIARDKFGMKPLFFAHVGDKFVFASQIRTLLKHPLVRPEIDITSISEIMLMGPGRTPGYGVFKNVQELKPASIGVFTKSSFITKTYWKLEAKTHTDSFEDTAIKIKQLLSDSIDEQTKSDKSFCCFLSGGLDSSIITAISGVKNTFSVDYEDNDKYFKSSKFQPDSDDEYIKIMTDFLGSNHTKITIDADKLVESLYLAVNARDLPGMADVDGSMLLFCKEVKKHASIALSGECADEFFGGYPWYRDKEIRTIDGFPWSQSTDYRASFIKDEILSQIDPTKYVYDKYLDTITNSSALEDESPLEKRMKEMFNLNTNWFMQTLISRMDRMSLYSGFEVRAPFCNSEIVEYVYNIPWEFKDYKGREKGLLRESMVGLLPEKVLWRKKSPYPKTHNPNYLTKVSQILSDIIASPSSPILSILKKDSLIELLKEEREIPWYGQLMTTPQTIAYLIQVNYWLKHYNISIV